ncbi:MAG: peptidoglycan editing factor PgeF [Thiomonas sp.]
MSAPIWFEFLPPWCDPAPHHAPWLRIAWPDNPRVHALFTSCAGGVSKAAYACAPHAQCGGMNLGSHVGDAPEHVAQNRARLQQALGGAQPRFLQQVHGVEVADLDAQPDPRIEPVADAASTTQPGVAATVLVADCLPVLLAAPQGRAVAAAHAGWRGLAAGVLEASLQRVCAQAGCDPSEVQAVLGPAIGPQAFEVGEEVRNAFVALHPSAGAAFRPGRPGKWWADIWQLARMRLEHAGMRPGSIAGGGLCTFSQPQRFYSYRRQPVTGRQAGCIWIDR